MTGPPRTASVATVREMNARAVLGVLRGSGPVTVAEVIAATGLSRPTVHLVLQDLAAAGWATAVDDDAPPDAGDLAPTGAAAAPTRTALGRPAKRYELAADAGYAIGVDMGVSTVRAEVADLRGTIRGAARRRSALDAGVRERVAAVRRAVESALDEVGAPGGRVLAVGLGVPAPVGPNGRVRASDAYLPGVGATDLAGAVRTALREALGDRLEGPVLLENDANLAALAERWRGAARAETDVVVLLAGERLGAGLVAGGRLLHGARGGAGEMGFLHVVEGVGDATGVAALARDLAAAAGLGERPAEEVFAAARAGDEVARGVVERVAERLARALTPLTVLLDPGLVVIGGAVALSVDVLLAPLERSLADLLPNPPRVAASALGAGAVVLGAVRLALDEVERTAGAAR